MLELERSYADMQYRWGAIRDAHNVWVEGRYEDVDPAILGIYAGRHGTPDLEPAHQINFNRIIYDLITLCLTFLPAVSGAKQFAYFDHRQLSIAFQDVIEKPQGLTEYLTELEKEQEICEAYLKCIKEFGDANLNVLKDQTKISATRQKKLVTAYNKAVSNLPVLDFAKMTVEALQIKKGITRYALARDHVRHATLNIELVELSLAYFAPVVIAKQANTIPEIVAYIGTNLAVGIPRIEAAVNEAHRHMTKLKTPIPSFVPSTAQYRN